MIIVAPSDQTEESITQQETLLPFADETIQFISKLSETILQDHGYRKYPDLIALAFWFRPAQLNKLKSEFERQRANRIWLARGRTFHIAPSNVDTLFVYSLFLSMLAGNINIVRLSERDSDQQQVLMDLLNKLLQDSEHREIKRRLMIVRYDHDDAITSGLSSHCDVRVLWGGDAAITHLRSIPIPPSAIELAFPDRFSFCILNAEAILSKQRLDQLAQRFYSDAYGFDQMACSSTKLVAWIGSADTTSQARTRFWTAVDKILSDRDYPLSASQAMDKLAAEYAIAIQASKVQIEKTSSNKICRVYFEDSKEMNRDLHCGSGLFFECRFDSLRDLKRFLSRKDQTVTSYGISADEWKSFLRMQPGGIHRVVPIGKALEFSPIWDGFDLLRSFCREVEIMEPS
jgi:hypothetical protein